MTERALPAHQAALAQRIRSAAQSWEVPELRLRRSIAHTIVGQMLPAGVVKGGAAIRMRVPELEARLTTDLDFSRASGQDVATFILEFEDNLDRGWANFEGRLVHKQPASPPNVPTEYVMVPFEVKLTYKTKSWCTVVLELGHDEAGSTDDPEMRMAQDIVQVFGTIGLPDPQEIPVMSVAQQAAQKLHACTSEPRPGEGNSRAHDLVDLQILDRVDGIDPAALGRVGPQLFDYRKGQRWPPVVIAHPSWDTLYGAAASGLEVLESVDEAVSWANGLIAAATANAKQEPGPRQL